MSEDAVRSLSEQQRQKIEDGKAVQGQRAVDRDENRALKMARKDIAGSS